MSVEADDTAPKPKRKPRRYRPMAERRARKGRNRGSPAFKPTVEQRFTVSALAGMRLSYDEMRLLVRNQHTGQAISKPTFMKAFKTELLEGPPKLKGLITSKYYQALGAGEPWAIKLGLRNRFRWALESGGEPDNAPVSGEIPSLNVVFVVPGAKGEPPPLVDVSPGSGPDQSAPDYSRPALPPPPHRERTPFGLYEHPDKDGWRK